MIISNFICLNKLFVDLLEILIYKNNWANNPIKRRLKVGQMPLDIADMTMDIGDSAMDIADIAMDIADMAMDIGDIAMDIADMAMDIGQFGGSYFVTWVNNW